MAGRPEELGRVHFPVSCKGQAQKSFERAVAMLHSFWYEEAAREFAAVTQADPACAMGYWGIAMSNWYPLWYAPDPTHFGNGRAAVEKAKPLGATTERERDYIGAIETFFKDSDKLDYVTRVQAYEKAMERVHLRSPDDREAAAFYALSLLGSAYNLPPDKTYARQKKAGEILEKIFTEQPRHPGASHYIIHSFDYPELATLALPAARNYAQIAPAVPHALHMPSHIFTRLGFWGESIESNRASATAAKDYGLKSHMDGAWDQQLHAMDYLEYAYLQRAQDLAARGVLGELNSIRKAVPENLTAAYAFAAAPARFAIERRAWQEARAIQPHPADFPWSRFPIGEAITRFARALGAARLGETQGARDDLRRLVVLREALLAAKDNYWASQVEILRSEAKAWLAHAEGRNEEGLRLMRQAAEREDSTEKHPATPGSIVPARELLGELLLELHEPTQALAEFEGSFKSSPDRFNGFYGAARAAELAGDRQKAKEFYARLVALACDAEVERPQLSEARAFLAKN